MVDGDDVAYAEQIKEDLKSAALALFDMVEAVVGMETHQGKCDAEIIKPQSMHQ